MTPSKQNPAQAAGMKRGQKVALSVAVFALAASIIGLGAYASFTSSVTGGPQEVSTGTLVAALGATGSKSNRLDIAATNVAPGDTIQRTVDLKNTGSIDFGSVSLTTAAVTGFSTVLDTDGTNGIQMKIERCQSTVAGGWTESASQPYTYTCVNSDGTAGTISTVFTEARWIQSGAALSNLALSAASTNNLRVTLRLPTTADDTFQGKTSKVGYTFVATQRAGTSK